MLKVNVTGETMIFRKDYEKWVSYSTTLGQKAKDGAYENAYIDVRFKGETDIPNKTKVEITNGWLKFRKDKENKTALYLFVNEYIVVVKVKPKLEEVPFEGFQALDSDEPF